MKPVIISKHIHSCFAGWSSNDERVYIYTTSDKLDFTSIDNIIAAGSIIISHNFPFISLEKIAQIVETHDIMYVYLEADKTLYEKGLRSRRGIGEDYKDELKEIVAGYLEKGWGLRNPEHSTEILAKKLSDREEEIRIELRILKGHVYGTWEKSGIDYRGALSEKVWNEQHLKEYLAEGGCHGYIGASERTFNTDRELEKVVYERGYTSSQFAEFMCSRPGRHFADQLHECDGSNDAEIINKYIDGYFWYEGKD